MRFKFIENLKKHSGGEYEQEYSTSCGQFTNVLTCIVRTIEFCRTGSGECPVELFLDSLSDQHARKVAWVLRLVEQLDNVPQQYLNKLEGSDDLREIRVQVGSMAYRLIGFFEKGPRLVLTNGFAKKQQRTPRREIEIALQRRRDHMQRRKQ